MRSYHLLAAVGILLIAAGFALLVQAPVLAQEATPEPMGEPPFLAEFYHAWLGSAHADASAEAFVHWDAEGEVPPECAKCHSTTGYQDFLGLDDTDFGTVDNPAPIGTVINCDACHNSVASTLVNVTFPSGAEVIDLSGSARCMECHQGRASGNHVEAALSDAGLLEASDDVDPELGFINIHYYAAAATLYGSEAHGGYEYPGQRYQIKNDHVPGYDNCAGCHSPHTLEVRVDDCAGCHEDVESEGDLRRIRMQGSGVDYDGDGDDGEGIAEEIETLQEMLYEAMQTYASEVAGTPIVYDEHAYPYFFVDTDGSGEVDEGEAVFNNAYKAFTGNLLKAAYNYQVTLKDPGGYAHNPKYHIQLLFDSIQSLNASVSEQVDMGEAARNDPGHFDSTAEAFRHWDADGAVPGTCARCHTASGLPVFLANGTNISEPPSESLACATCHDDFSDFTIYEVDEVRFPSGAVLSFGEGEPSNLCLNCHQGRESTVSVNTAIARAGVGDDEVSEALTFRNVHYFAAGASLFGTEAKGAYEYEGKEYNGRFFHADDAPNECATCHQRHELTVRINQCEDCHDNVEEPEDVLLIREDEGEPIDYDGDGSADEPIRDEILTLEEALYAAIQTYASETIGTGIAYDPFTHPYWFNDSNGNGATDPDEVNGDNRFVSWTPTLLRAAYNYQYTQKDPGDFAHNPDYILQVLYDSIEAVGGEEAAADYTRPPVSQG